MQLWQCKIAFGFLLLLGLPISAKGDTLKSAESVIAKTNQDAVHSQKRIDSTYDSIHAKFQEYRRLTAETESLTAYNKQLASLVKSQRKELQSLTQQLDEIETTKRDILPLIERMINMLGRFVDSDMPFLLQERKDRVARLQANLHSADISLSEKYRQVLEAYQIENDYGKSIQAYRKEMSIDGTVLTVDILRLGRVGLYYRTLDGEKCGYYDKSQAKWLGISNSYQGEIKKGIRLAHKQLAPTFLELPLQAPSVAIAN